MDPRSDLLTGINSTDVTNLNLDTKQRLDSMFSQIPEKVVDTPTIDFGKFGVVSPGQNINIDPDEKLRNQMLNNYTNYSKGKTFADNIEIPQTETRRYLGQDYGFRIDRDNEDFYNHTQNSTKEIFKSLLLRFPSLTLTKLGTGIGYVAGLINPINWFQDNYVSAAADNGISKFFDGIEDDIKNEWLPIYQKASARDMGFFQRALHDQTFWHGDFVDGAAFMASAFVPGMAVSKLGLGAKLAAGLGALDEVASSSKLVNALGNASLKYGDKVLTTALNTASESMFEAKGVKDALYDKLKKQGVSEKEAQDQAGDAARNTFLGNLAALSFSNAWETNIFFKAMGKSSPEAKKLAETAFSEAYKAAEPSTKLGKFFDTKFGFYAKKALEGVGVEGFYEENIQLAIQRMQQRDNKYGDTLSQFIGQTKDAIEGNDPEASMNIGMGGLMGAIIGVPSGIISKEYTHEKLETQKLIDTLNSAKNNWTKLSEIYEQGPDGKYTLNNQKLSSISLQQFKNADELNKANNTNDPIVASLTKKQLFSSLVASHLNNGTFDNFMKQLQDLTNVKPEDLIKMGFDPDQNSKEQIPEYIQFANQIKDIKENLDRKIIKDPRDILRKNIIYNTEITKLAIGQEISKLDNQILKTTNQIGNQSPSDYNVDELNLINAQRHVYQLQKDSLEDKDFVDKRILDLTKQHETLEKQNSDSLKKTKKDSEGYYSYESNEKNNNPLINNHQNDTLRKAQLLNSIHDINNYQDKVNKNKEGFLDKIYDEQKEDIDKVIKDTLEQSEKEEKKKEEKPEDILTKIMNDSKQEAGVPTTTQVQKTPVQEAQAQHKDNFESLRDEVSKKESINNNDKMNIVGRINKASDKGLITDAQYDALINELDTRKVTGTPFDQPENEEQTEETKPQPDESPENATKSDEVPEAEQQTQDVNQGGYNYSNSEVQDIIMKPDESLLAYRTSLKTVTQEEQDENGRYTGKVVDDPYLKFKQKFIRDLVQYGNINGYKGVIIKDDSSFPKELRTQKFIENGGQLGYVLAVSDQANNIVYFDKDYKENSQGQPIIFSFTKDYWNDTKDLRAALASDREGIPIDEILKNYEAEDQKLKLARQLAQTGSKVPVKLSFFVPGALRVGVKPNPVREILKDQNYDLTIAQDLHGEKYVLSSDNRYLVNGGLYAVIKTDGEPAVYVRIIPNKISNTNLYNQFRDLFLHKYTSEQQANEVRDYLINNLYLNVFNRPTLVVSSDETGYYIDLLSNKVLQPKDAFFEILDKARFNVLDESIKSNIHREYFIDGNNLAFKEVEYKDFIHNNSTTTILPIFEDGKHKFRYLNSYIAFEFEGGLDDNLNASDQPETEVSTIKTIYQGYKGNPDSREFNYFTEDPEEAENYGENVRKVNIDTTGFLKDNYYEEINNFRNISGKTFDILDNTKEGLKVQEEFFRFLKDKGYKGIDLTGGVDSQYIISFDNSLIKEVKEEVENKELTKEPLKRKKLNVEDAGNQTDEEIEKLLSEKKNKEDDLFNREGLKALIVDNEANYDTISTEEVNFIRDRFGKDSIRLIGHTVNSDAWGLWKSSGIKLYSFAPAGTGYHEAWHHFSQLYLTKGQKRNLYDEVRSRSINFKSRDGRKLNTQSASDFDIEEFTADDFRDYVMSGGKSRLVNAPYRNTLFRRILDFIKSLFFGNINIDKLYNDLFTNELNHYTPSFDNAMWGKLNAGIENKEGVEIFSPHKASYWNNIIDALVGEYLLNKTISIQDMENYPKIAARVYSDVFKNIANNYYNPLYDRYEKDEIDEDVIIDLEKLIQNWPDIVSYNTTHTKLGYFIEDELPEVEDETPQELDIDETQAGGDEDLAPDVSNEGDRSPFERLGNDTSSLNAASLETKSLIRMLPEMKYQDGEFIRVTDKYGFPKLNEYSRTWNNIALELSNSPTYTAMYNKLKDSDFNIRVPETTELLKRIPDPTKHHTDDEIERITKFFQDFNRSYVGIYSASFNTSSKDFFFLEETKRNVDNIQKIWSSNFIGISDNDFFVQNKDVIFDEKNQKYKLNPARKLSYTFQKQDHIDTFMPLLGISISPETYENTSIRKVLPGILSQIQNNINARHAVGDEFYNPVSDLKRDFKKIKGLSSIINALSIQETKYNNQAPSLSYMTAEGNMQYGLSLNNYLTTVINLINRISNKATLKNLLETKHLSADNNPNVKNSIFLKALYNENGTKKTYKVNGEPVYNQILIGNYNGLKLDLPNRKIAGSTTSLNTRQKIVMDINSLLSKGAIEIMRTESSTSAYFIKLNKYDNGSTTTPIPISSFSVGFGGVEFLSIIRGYLEDELTRIKSFNADVNNDIIESSKQFHLFRDILSSPEEGERLKDDLKEQIKDKDISEVIDKNFDRINKSIVKYFQKEYGRLIDHLDSENITTNEISKQLADNYDYGQLIRAFVANDFILNVEYLKLFNGDLSYQKNYKDYHKRSKLDISTGKIPLTESLFKNYMQRNENATFAGFIKSKYNNDYRTVRSAVISDFETSSSYFDILKDNIKQVRPDLNQEQVDKMISKYSNLNVADGQGHITLDFYRQFLISIGNWDIKGKQEIAYQAELAWFRLNYSTLNENYSESQKARDEAYVAKYHPLYNPNLDHASFPPMKIQYSGPIDIDGTLAHVGDKFSVAPLIPSIIKGTQWEEPHINMIKNGIGYTKFKSGTKKYVANTIKMYNEDGSVSLSFDNYKAPIHYLMYLKEQINTKSSSKPESIFGSQVRKLVMSNLFSNGKSSEKNEQRRARYKSIIAGMTRIEKTKLYDELGLTEKNGNVHIDNLEHFVKELQKQIKQRDLNDNIKEYIQYDQKTKSFVYPLESSLNRSPIQDLIMGLIHRRVVRQKVNGDQLIQISSAGFESNQFKYKNATEDEIKKYGTTGLRFYHLKDGKTQAMQVKVGLIGGFEKLLELTHSDGSKIGSIERLNKLLKDENWVDKHRDHITIIGYRIPTQGPNSMEFMEVSEFLPASVGSSIIVPAEIVTKAGSDFDIDKLSIFRPSFDKNGRLINKDSDNYDTQKQKLSNDIISLFKDVLSDSEMFDQLITPNSTDTVKPVVNDVAVALGKKSRKQVNKEEKEGKPSPYSGTQVVSYINNLRKFDTLLSAKRLLGIFAVNNAFSQLVQQGGTRLNLKYGEFKDKSLKLFLLSPEERSKIVEGDKINVSLVRDVIGMLKQDYLSQLINGTVDAGSDDFLGYVNLSYENAGVICYMINLGIPFERAIWFVNQPVITEYYSRLKKDAGKNSKLTTQAEIMETLGSKGMFFSDDEEGRYVNKKGLEKEIYNTLETLGKGKSGDLYISLDHMKKFMEKGFRDSPQYSKLMFAYFLSLQEQASMFRNFQSVLKFDTVKFATPIDAVGSLFRSTGNNSYALKDRLIDQEYFDKIAKDSIISPLDSKKLSFQVVSSLMPVGYDAQLLSDAYKEVDKIFKKTQKQKASKTIANDWIEFLVKSLGQVNGVPLYEHYESMIKGKNSLARRLNLIKRKFPELSDRYSFFKKLVPNFSTDTSVKNENIEVSRVFENTADDQNKYIDEFRQLINFNDSTYSTEEQLQIKNFFKDLALFGFLQSGFGKSNISFQELIPFEELAEVFSTALQRYKTMFQTGEPKAKAARQLLVKSFIEQLKRNNTKIFGGQGGQSWRGKMYIMNSVVNKTVMNYIEEASKGSGVEKELIKQQIDPIKKSESFIENIGKKTDEEIKNPQSINAPKSEEKPTDQIQQAANLYLKEWLEENPRYYTPVPKEKWSNISDEEYEEYMRKPAIRITLENVEDAKAQDKELGDQITNSSDPNKGIIESIIDPLNDWIDLPMDESEYEEFQGFNTLLDQIQKEEDPSRLRALQRMAIKYGLLDMKDEDLEDKFTFDKEDINQLSKGLADKIFGYMDKKDYNYLSENDMLHIMNKVTMTPDEKEELRNYLTEEGVFSKFQDPNQLRLFDETDDIINQKDKGC